MTKWLTSLTPDQEALMATVRDEWIAHGLNCTPADRPTAERGIRTAYEAAGLAPPRVIVWLDSPLAGAVAAVMWPHWFGDQVGGQVHDQVYGQVDDQVGGQVRGQVDGQVDDQVDDQVGGQVYDQVHGQVDGQVHDQVDGQVHDQVHVQVHGQVRGQVHDQVGGQVHDQVGGQVHDQVGGQVHDQVDVSRWGRYIAGNLWAGYYAWLDFYQRVGVSGLEPTAGQVLAAQSAGMWWPMRDACIVVERPILIRGEQVAAAGWGSHQLHCEDGPAAEWPDGWAIWAWHGTRVPRWVVEGPTLDLIRGESNTEIRRCAIESYGWGQYLEDLGASPVDECPDPGNPGHRLRLFDLPDQLYDEPVRLLVMDNASRDRDGSRRTYGETVPAACRSALDAAAWQFDIDPDLYRSLARAT